MTTSAFGITDDARRARLRQCTMLLVDDEIANLDLLDALLSGEGYDFLVRTSDPREVPALVERDAKSVDSTGAGDLFRAGVLYGLDQGWDLDRCLSFGAAAGALICRVIGATANVPTVEEIENLIARSQGS